MDSMFVMIDMIVAGFGCYILYGWFLMKSKGEVKENLILPKGVTMKHCKDRAGFIAEIQPKMLAFGIATLACGAMGILNDFTQLLGNIYLVITIIFLVVVFWFGKTRRHIRSPVDIRSFRDFMLLVPAAFWERDSDRVSRN